VMSTMRMVAMIPQAAGGGSISRHAICTGKSETGVRVIFAIPRREKKL